MIHQQEISLHTQGRSSHEITNSIQNLVSNSQLSNGLCNLFIQHTSASLIISENADPDVHRDLELILARLAPDNDPQYAHTIEGPDDMAAHIRSVLTQTSLSIPIANNSLCMGTWQGIYLWEHRYQPHHRRIMVTLVGD
mgnify:CR=1 FL=1